MRAAIRSVSYSIVYTVSLAVFGVIAFASIPLLIGLTVAVLTVGWVAAFGMVAGVLSLIGGMLLNEPAAYRGALMFLGLGAAAFAILTVVGGLWHAGRDRLRRRRDVVPSPPLRLSLRPIGQDASFDGP